MKMYLIGRDLWEITTNEEVIGERATEEEKRTFKKKRESSLIDNMFVSSYKSSNIRKKC